MKIYTFKDLKFKPVFQIENVALATLNFNNSFKIDVFLDKIAKFYRVTISQWNSDLYQGIQLPLEEQSKTKISKLMHKIQNTS